MYYDGSTPYDPYSHHIGDTITVAGEQYRVIAASGSSQDYVTALKVNPLTRKEITAAGGTSETSADGVGIMAYATSAIKSVVDSWATLKFTNGELKTVDGYSARLITFNELTTNLGYEWGEVNPTLQGYRLTDSTLNWVYVKSYWTMSPNNDSSTSVWAVRDNGTLGYTGIVGTVSSVRPVINVYKSKISS